MHGDGLKGEGVVSTMPCYNKRHLSGPPRSLNFPVAPQAAAEQTKTRKGAARLIKKLKGKKNSINVFL